MILSNDDIVWVLLCAILVFVMQAGFLCLESGLTRAKNAINVAIKNIADFAVALVLFWAFSFALMFGTSTQGLIGTGPFAADVGPGAEPGFSAFFLFQAMFVATAATIVSGAVAERMRFAAYLLVTAAVAAIIYPVFGHWAWGGALGTGDGWLQRLGFVDFAGSTVVHSVGGWVALAAILVIGPRRGRFAAAQAGGYTINGSNRPLAALGALLLFLGWFGFNGGSTFALDNSVPGILVNTMLAAVGGILAGLFLGWRMHGYGEVVHALNGAIAGLVAITAGAHVMSAAEAILIGMVGGAVMVAAQSGMLRLHLDDAVGAIPAHLAAGIWGSLAVALFGDLERIGTGLTRLEQLGTQLAGVTVCGLWSFGVAYLLLRGINRFFPLRVTDDEERIGLNVSEHGARTELQELLQTLESQETSGDLSLRVPAEPFTEVGQIAAGYNRVMDSLERAVDRTRAIVRDVRDGVVTLGRDGRVRSLNPGAEKLFGLAEDRALGQPVGMLLQGSPPSHPARAVSGWVPGNKMEFRIRPPGASPRYLEVSVSESHPGQERLLTGLVRDVTDRRQYQEQLQHQRDLAEVTLASIGDGVITTDERGVIQYLNPVAERLTGWSLKNGRGRDIGQVYRLRDEATGKGLDNPVRTVLAGGNQASRHEHGMLESGNSHSIPVQDTASPIRDRKDRLVGAVLVFHDVTETLDLTRELTHQASHDALTGIPNRRAFEKRLAELLKSPHDPATPHVLCYLDLDQFKVVNDTCGHVAGDELLRQITDLLHTEIRRNDLLARLGGDEFGILFQGCPLERASAIAEQLRELIQGFRFAWEGQTFAVGVSIGLVPLGAGDRSLGKMLAAADTACYAAKEAGRNRVHVYGQDDDELARQHGQMQWVGRLRDALDQDRLRLYAQPIVPLALREADSVSHYEILVRLEEGGQIVSPGAFIPAAERYGMMPEIDEWVVKNTLAWLGDLHRQQAPLPGMFCINLSGVSLSDARCRNAIFDSLEQAALPPGSICIEVTESAAVASLSKVVDFIRRVQQMGGAFALDDFGSGLSSFAYLKTLPVDYLKIDGGFVKDIEHDPIDLAMVRAINAIGHTMGLKTIAEFVESPAVLEQLRNLGVDFAQGYHVGRPQPLARLHRVRMMPR